MSLQYGQEHTVTDGKGEAMRTGLTASSLRQWPRALPCVFLLAVLAFTGCARTSPEQALRQQLEHMQASLEANDARAFMDGVAEDFVGKGGLDRAALQQGVRAQVLANRSLGVTLGPVEVDLHGSQATTVFTAITTGGNGAWLPERAQAWQVTAGWRERDGQWLLYHLDWDRH